MHSNPSKKDADILSVCRKRLDMAISALSVTRNNEVNDLKFASGSSDNNWQWDPNVITDRSLTSDGMSARPCLTINKLPQHIKQVTNDQRQNRIGARVIPANSGANVEVAEVYQGIIRYIESRSDADVAYETASENQVTFGEGYFRILTEYCDEATFDQDIRIKRIKNSFSVYMDPMIQEPCGEDAEWAAVSDNMLHEEYEMEYPKAALVSSLNDLGINDNSATPWTGDKTIRIVEYFYYETTTENLNLYPGGETAFDGTPEDEQLRMMYVEPERSRKAQRRKVKHIKTNGYEILEDNEWAGKYIPIIRVVGNEVQIENEIHIWGIVRNAKDPQRLYNYWKSQEAEMLALAPKAPFIGYGGQFEGYETQWKTANTKPHPYLEVNAIVDEAGGHVLPLPQRAQPPMVQSGLIAAAQAASEDIKETTGQYNASLGMTSNERTGKAILARQHEGEKSTYHYGSNLSRAVRYLTRQLIDLIPKIYDTPGRVAQVLGEDGSTKMVKLNPTQPEAVKEIKGLDGTTIEKIYNPNVGKYDVVPTTGPSYATKRQEQAAAMQELMQTNPQLFNLIGDLFVKHMDWPGAGEISKRLAKAVPAELMADKDDPATQQAQKQIQELTQQLQQAMQMLQNINKSMEARELDIKEYEANIRAYDAETKRIQVTAAGMTPEQIQEIVMGTIAGAVHSGDLIGQLPDPPQLGQQQPQMEPQQAPQPMMPGGQ